MYNRGSRMNHSSDATTRTRAPLRACVARSHVLLPLLCTALLLSGCGEGKGGNPPPPARPGILQFEAVNLTFDENASTATLTITRTGGSDGAVSVTVASTDVSAAAGQDYTVVSQTVRFAAGDAAAKTVPIEIKDDAQGEADESFTVTLSAPTGGAAVGAPATQQLTISDNDAPAAPALQVGANIKQLRFSWASVPGAATYRLFQSPDGLAYTQLGDDHSATVTSATLDIAVHQHDWVNASYRLEACNAHGCSSSPPLSTMRAMLDAIGYFKSSNPQQFAFFGSSLAMSADGRTLAVSAIFEQPKGGVYVFTRADGQWSQQASLVPSEGPFGSMVALSSDGNTLAVGAEWEDGDDDPAEAAGAVYVFARTGTQWSQSAHFTPSKAESHDSFGRSLTLSGDGRTLAVGAPFDDRGNGQVSISEAGAAYVFTLADDGHWSEPSYLKAPDPQANAFFGHRLSLSSDGKTLAISAPLESDVGTVYLFEHNGTSWSQPISVQASNPGTKEEFGTSLALAADGNTLAVGAPDWDETLSRSFSEGTVYVFAREADHWVASGNIRASNVEPGDDFAYSVALSADGSVLAVGATLEDSDAVGVGGAEGNSSAGIDSGAVYVFRRAGTQWSQSAYVKASNTGRRDRFGNSIALSADGDTLAVGAVSEASAASGIGGDQSNNDASHAGAVYVY